MCELCNTQELENGINEGLEIENNVDTTEDIMRVSPNLELMSTENKPVTTNNIPNKLQGVVMPEINNFGVENLTKVGKVLASLTNDTVESFEDGKFSASDLTNYIDSIPSILGAIPALSKVGDEINDTITAEEEAEFIKSVSDELDLENELDKNFAKLLLKASVTAQQLWQNRKARAAEKKAAQTSTAVPATPAV